MHNVEEPVEVDAVRTPDMSQSHATLLGDELYSNLIIFTYDEFHPVFLWLISDSIVRLVHRVMTFGGDTSSGNKLCDNTESQCPRSLAQAALQIGRRTQAH